MVLWKQPTQRLQKLCTETNLVLSRRHVGMCFLFVRRSSVRRFFKTQSHSVSAFATDFSGCDSCGLQQSCQSFQVYASTIWWVRFDKQTQVLPWITESHGHLIAQLLRSTWRSQPIQTFCIAVISILSAFGIDQQLQLLLQLEDSWRPSCTSTRSIGTKCTCTS